MITRILDLILKASNVSVLYETKVGVKCLNQLVSSDVFPYVSHGETPFLIKDDLLIGFDGLKDASSLLGTPISRSPHFELVKLLSENRDISTSDYLKRTKSGSLDFRRAHKVNTAFEGFVRARYEEKTAAVESGDYLPIKVFKVAEKYYIADGKHTAAVCSLVGADPLCVDISHIVYDSFFWWVYRKMCRNRNHYIKHIEYFEQMKVGTGGQYVT